MKRILWASWLFNALLPALLLAGWLLVGGRGEADDPEHGWQRVAPVVITVQPVTSSMGCATEPQHTSLDLELEDLRVTVPLSIVWLPPGEAGECLVERIGTPAELLQ